MNFVKSLLIMAMVIFVAGCSNLVVNNKYVQNTNTIAPMRLPAGQKALGIKATYPVPPVTAAGKKMPNIFPPGV